VADDFGAEARDARALAALLGVRNGAQVYEAMMAEFHQGERGLDVAARDAKVLAYLIAAPEIAEGVLTALSPDLAKRD